MNGKFIQVHYKGLRHLIHVDCIMNIQETFNGDCVMFLKDGKGKTSQSCPDEPYDAILKKFDFAVVRKNNFD